MDADPGRTGAAEQIHPLIDAVDHAIATNRRRDVHRGGLPDGRRGHHEPMCATDTARSRLAVALAGVLVLSGCGDSTPQLAPIERKELHAFVDRARSAATERDLAATNAALEALRARVRALREAGRIDAELAQRLLKYSAIAQLRARTTLRPEPSPAPAAEPDADAAAAAEAEPLPPAAPAAEADPGGGNDKGNDDEDKNKDHDKDGNANDKAGE